MSKKTLNIAMVGYKFMGKAHSQAWREAPLFFDLPANPRLMVVCGRHEAPLRDFADRWGWESTSTDWREAVTRPEVDVVDICAPSHLHFEVAMTAAEAGKAIFCEKPLCLTVDQAEQLVAAVKKQGVLHYLNHNYRRCPAVAYAKRLIDDGRIGRPYHWRSCYLQDWIMDPDFPLTWHLQKDKAGAGAHADLNSHSIDLARFLVGEIVSVQARMTTFIKQRPIVEGASTFNASAGSDDEGGPAGGEQGRVVMGEVDVDDLSMMQVMFENGAMGSFEASRFAGGRKNYNYFELYGSEGSLIFNFERMNELELYDRNDDAEEAGFKRILVTEATHPYVDAWWPPGHLIGYEHTFVHAVADFVKALDGGTSLAPNFDDGLMAMHVLDAAMRAAEHGRQQPV